MDELKVGIIGCGNISDMYCRGLRLFDILDLRACADLEMDRAHKLAEAHGIRALAAEELLADPDIDIVVNLTPPVAHAEVALAAIAAGKHVQNEKPLAQTRAQAIRIRETAASAGLRVGCAPDTFLGGGLQTCRKLLDDGWIGQPVAASAFFLGHGPEHYHPNPDFFYQEGGGPLFDMAPYYLTALIHLLGPVKRVTGSAAITAARHRATSPELPPEQFGYLIDVQVPTHVSAVLDFRDGSIATLITSFDVWSNNLPRIEIYGSEGTLSVPDPNHFRGPVRVKRAGADDWSEIPLTHNPEVLRGIGVADLAHALRAGRRHRASAAMAWHVLDLMHAIMEASEQGRHVDISSSAERPTPLPTGLLPGRLDD